MESLSRVEHSKWLKNETCVFQKRSYQETLTIVVHSITVVKTLGTKGLKNWNMPK